MKIVIDISNDYYITIKQAVEYGNDFRPYNLIANGTPLPKGHWIPDKSRPALQDCSICGALSIAKTNYCSNCGGDMRGDDNGE